MEQTNCLSTYLLLNWQIFGSSGHTVQPPSVRINFTRSAATPHKCTKYIARTNALRSFRVHHPIMWRNMSKPWQMPRQQPPLVLNHYLIQSRERFETVKMTRGDVHRPGKDQVRTLEYFKQFDTEANETDNVELRDIVLSAEPSRFRSSTNRPLTHRKPPYMHGFAPFATTAGPRDTALVSSNV